jgi:predicted HTH domain antitoxin
LAINFGSSGSDVVAANKTTTDADGNGFDSPEGEANPFLSESVVVSAGMATPSPVDPQFQSAEVVKEYIILGLYQEDRISGGKAAELLGVPRRGFVALLARKGIDTFRLMSDEWT